MQKSRSKYDSFHSAEIQLFPLFQVLLLAKRMEKVVQDAVVGDEPVDILVN